MIRQRNVTAEPQTLTASVLPTPPASRLRISDFAELGPTPGNVAICLSGGGSRALTAGMGQLRALRYLKSGNDDLVSLARALSTVSGGSWLGTTWAFLPPSTPDDAYLNQFVADPRALVPSGGLSQAVSLDTLPDGNIGQSIDNFAFSPEALAFKALLLHRFDRVPTDMIWQTLVGLHILKPYGLFTPGRHRAPTSLFSYDSQVWRHEVTEPNPSLAAETAHLVTSADATHSRRPFLVCNTSMFVRKSGAAYENLAPVQCTPFRSGIVGHPDGSDANGKRAGGGWVTSFAFNSTLQSVSGTGDTGTGGSGTGVTVAQSRQWSLCDIVGASSAFFAEILQNLFKQWQADPSKLLEVALRNQHIGREFAQRHMSEDAAVRVMDRLGDDMMQSFLDRQPRHSSLVRDFLAVADALQDIIPQYTYWPVRNLAPDPGAKPTRFADGGNLENTGIADALSYDDIERVIAGVNSSEPLETGSMGVMESDGSGGLREVPGTRIVVSSQIPPLFGYQPYDAKDGYILYAGDDDPQSPAYRNNQVFESGGFAEFLKELWQAMGNTEDPAQLGPDKPGKKQSAPKVRQTLTVTDNEWFHVHGTLADGSRRQVEVLWFYLDRVRDWYDQLQPDVQAILGDFDDPKSYSSFPNYSTLKTDLSATELNLMAHLTAWCVAGEPNAAETLAMFDGAV